MILDHVFALAMIVCIIASIVAAMWGEWSPATYFMALAIFILVFGRT